MIVHVGLTGTKQDEKKANRNGDFQDGLQKDGFTQPDESHGRLFQKLNTAWRESYVFYISCLYNFMDNILYI